jgi:hypothetical protein
MDKAFLKIVLDDYIERYPDCLVAEDNQAMIIAFKNHSFLATRLKLPRVNKVFNPRFIAYEFNSSKYIVIYDLSFASINNEEPKHIHHLPKSALPTIVNQWLDKHLSFNASKERITSFVNIHDLAFADSAHQEEWLLTAITNTQSFFTDIYASADIKAMVQKELYQQFFNKLDSDLGQKATLHLCRSNQNVLFLIPEKYRTYEICDVAISHSLANLRHTPKQHLLNGLYEYHADGKSDVLHWVSSSIIDMQFAKLAVSLHPKSLLYIPERLRVNELFEHAIAKHPHSIAYVPLPLLSTQLCTLAAKIDASVLELLPAKWISTDLLKVASTQSKSFFYFVPYRLRTLELCQCAVELEPSSRQFVPHTFVKQIRYKA